MTIEITVFNMAKHNYMNETFEKVEKYYFENDFLIMERDNKILMINKNNILQISII